MYFSPQEGFVRPLISLMAEYALVCHFARIGGSPDVGGFRSGPYELIHVVQYDDTFTAPIDRVSRHTAPPGVVAVIGQGRFSLLGKKREGSSVLDYALVDSQNSESPHALNARATLTGAICDGHDGKYGDRLYVIGTLPDQLIIADNLPVLMRRKNHTGPSYGCVIDSSGDHVRVRPIRWAYKGVLVDDGRFGPVVDSQWTPLDADEYALPRGVLITEPVWIRAVYNDHGKLASVEAASFNRSYTVNHETTRFPIDEKGVPLSLLIYNNKFVCCNWENGYHPERWAQPRAARPCGEAGGTRAVSCDDDTKTGQPRKKRKVSVDPLSGDDDDVMFKAMADNARRVGFKPCTADYTTF